MKHKLSLHIFRRDLRLNDNTALIKALEESEKVIACFIFNKQQIENNDYRSDNCVQFLINSLNELNQELKKKNSKLYLFYGENKKVIDSLIKNMEIDAVYFNKDYTPFSLKRDQAIKKICDKHKIDCKSYADVLLNPPGSVLKEDGKPYTVYGPFFKKAKLIKVRKPHKNNYTNYFNGKIKHEVGKDIFKKVLSQENNNVLLNGGLQEAKKLISNMKSLKRYSEKRNIPSVQGTTLLSAHHKFGTISIRESYWAIAAAHGMNHSLISELYWRDFFTHIIYHFPYVLQGAFHKKFDKLKWSNSKKEFDLWCQGRTGFPIVDAGMRELNETGFMHNRVRMIVASFLVKDLHLNWQWGEKYFAQKLIDYDPAVNNGNWQWAASTGCDAQPYFRIFNPWTQQKRFDPNCEYIQMWVPELKEKSCSEIHSWQGSDNYPAPIVDHSEERKKALELYSRV